MDKVAGSNVSFIQRFHCSTCHLTKISKPKLFASYTGIRCRPEIVADGPPGVVEADFNASFIHSGSIHQTQVCIIAETYNTGTEFIWDTHYDSIIAIAKLTFVNDSSYLGNHLKYVLDCKLTFGLLAIYFL